MKVELKPNTRRKVVFYAIKNLSDNTYLDAHWGENGHGVEYCSYQWFGTKLVRVSKDLTVARRRLPLAIDRIKEDLAAVERNPPSHWRAETANKLASLLAGNIAVVEIEVDLNVEETIL